MNKEFKEFKKDTKVIKKFLKKWYGKKCKDHDADCINCQSGH